MIGRENMTGQPSINNDLPCNPSRPKIVLVNPNFQKRLLPDKKTIHVNPLFNRLKLGSIASGKFCDSNVTASSSVSRDTSPILSNEPSAMTNSQSSLKTRYKFIANQPKPTSEDDDLKNWFLSQKPNKTIAQENPHQLQFLQSNQMKQCGNSCTSIQNPSNISRSQKTFVNPKFINRNEEVKPNVKKKASFYYVNTAVLKQKVAKDQMAGTTNNHLSLSSVSLELTANCKSSALSSGVAEKQITSNPVIGSEFLKDSTVQTKAAVGSHSVKNSFQTPERPSTSSTLLSKSAQKKELNLQKLRRITKLSNLMRSMQYGDKNSGRTALSQVSSTNSARSVINRCKYSFKPSSVKQVDRYKKTNCEGKNSFINFNRPLQSQCSSPKKLPNNLAGRSDSQKYHLTLKNILTTSQSAPKNIFQSTDKSIVYLNSSTSSSQPHLNLEEFGSKSSLEPRKKTSIINVTSTSSVKDDKNSTSPRLLYVSRRKLIRKQPTPRISQQVNKLLIFNSKFSLRNVNPTQSKCSSPSTYKIHFKPSRTSSDVINKRMIQRQMINRYKLSNVQHSQVKTPKSHSSAQSLDKPSHSKYKKINSPRVRRHSVMKNGSFSFVSIGKTKLIRKSTLDQKRSHRTNISCRAEATSNNLKSSRKSTSKYSKINHHKFSWKACEYGKSVKNVSNNLVAIGKTKLIRQSLLHHQRQANKCSKTLTNIAAASVIQKKLRKLRKSQPENGRSKKIQRAVHLSKLKLKNVSSTAGNNSLTRRRIALRRKNNTPCENYHKYGRCKMFLAGKCLKLHDKKYVAICQAFIQGACKNDKCLLSHDTIPQKMPTCLHFLQGACSRNNCLYPHVKLSSKAPICRDFVRGFCPLGLECDKLHVLLCPELEKDGVCSNKANCKFAHRKKVHKKKINLDKLPEEDNSTTAATAQLPKIEDSPSTESEMNDEPSRRYFSTSSEKELKSFIPQRPKLGTLPSFIPLSSCDS
ncbi:unnamed protein product [Bemisia tabaci]|uniref:C3H1-type domain-containing protein n=1 Tax=Bemisia tabaci TaxID=7038 RepID=A0A9P0F2D9_BEMTA|nr:unnamed protein product [Bemisia tabaci]